MSWPFGVQSVQILLQLLRDYFADDHQGVRAKRLKNLPNVGEEIPLQTKDWLVSLLEGENVTL